MYPSTRFRQVLLAASAVVFGSVSAYTGHGTVYGPIAPSGGNCAFMSFPDYAYSNYAAINKAQWDDTMNCGRCARVKCVDTDCVNPSKESEIVYIIDQCPGCMEGDLDLSPTVFEAITGFSYTILNIEWEFVTCPMDQKIEYCLKPGSSAYWAAIQPTNMAAGVDKVTIDGKETSMVESAYFFLLDGKSVHTTDISHVTIQMTSVTGEVIEDVISFANAECVEGTSQFSGGGSESLISTPESTPTATPVSSTTATTPEPTTATPEPTTAAPTEPATTAPATQEPTELPTPIVAVTEAPVTEEPTSEPTPTATETPETASSTSTSSPTTNLANTTAPVTEELRTELPSPTVPLMQTPAPSAEQTTAPPTATETTAGSTASLTTEPTIASVTEEPATELPMTTARVAQDPVTDAPASEPTLSATSTEAPTSVPTTEAPKTEAPISTTATSSVSTSAAPTPEQITATPQTTTATPTEPATTAIVTEAPTTTVPLTETSTPNPASAPTLTGTPVATVMDATPAALASTETPQSVVSTSEPATSSFTTVSATTEPASEETSTTSVATAAPAITTAAIESPSPKSAASADENTTDGTSESVRTRTAGSSGSTIVVSVVAVLGCLLVGLVFFVALIIKKKKALNQQLEQEKMPAHGDGSRYSSDSDFHANVAIDEQKTFSYTAVATPQPASFSSL